MRTIVTPDGKFVFNRDTGEADFDPVQKIDVWERPIYAQVAVTTSCNLSGYCSWCYADPVLKGVAMEPTRFLDIARVLDSWGILGISLGGGEAFTWPALEEVVKKAHDSTELAFSITTNGILGTEERLKRLEGYVGEIRLSIYDEFSFRAIPRYLGKKFDFGTNILLIRGKSSETIAKIKRAYGLGVRDFMINGFMPAGRGTGLEEAVPVSEDYYAVLGAIPTPSSVKVSGVGINKIKDRTVLVPFSDQKRGRIVAIKDHSVKLSSLENGEGIPFSEPSEIPSAYRRLVGRSGK